MGEDEEDGDFVGGGKRREARKNRTAPWEDIQWRNVPAAGVRGGKTAGGKQDEEEEGGVEEGDVGLDERRPRRGRLSADDSG